MKQLGVFLLPLGGGSENAINWIKANLMPGHNPAMDLLASHLQL